MIMMSKKSTQRILSGILLASLASGATFAAVTVDPSTTGNISGADINIVDAPEGKNVDGSTGASIMITDASAGRVIVDMDTYKPAEHKNTAKVVIVGQRSDFGLNSWAGHSGTAIGANTTAEGDNSTALGIGATANGTSSTALGTKAVANGENSTAIGSGATVADTVTNGTALGAGAQATVNNSTAIGAGSVATEENSVSFGNAATGTYYKLTNVENGTIAADSHDVISGTQLYSEQVAREKADTAMKAEITGLSTNVRDLGKEIDSVGAVSAALAGLHPLDYNGTGSKFQIAAAAGTYDGKQAAALGGFYHASQDVLLSFAASTSFGDHKTAANVGATFRVGEGSSSVVDQNTKLLNTVNTLVDDVATLKDENANLKAQLAALQAKQ